MSRPFFSRVVDRENEERCVRMLTGLGFTVLQFNQGKETIDFLCWIGTAFYWVEYKRRNHTFGTYPTAIMPAQKLKKSLLMSRWQCAPYIYLTEYDDGYYWCKPTKYEDYKIEVGGRTDRGSPWDIYPMAHIPIEELVKL